jgi:glycosyltransferase involved in cell wall biosynthesis
MIELPLVSIVVIGRNEENNLEATFRAIESIDYSREKLEIIYVDSNSTDRSVEIARKHAAAVFVEDHPLSSAARGRNRGLVEARHGIVHFVDGDVTINASYLKKAVDILSNPAIHAVTGVICEKSRTGLSRIVSACWAAPKEGPVGFTATGGTYKRNALMQVDGYDERLTLGEESELGERFRCAGFTIWSTLQEMGVHDYGIASLTDFLRFLYRDGRVKTRTMLIDGSSDYFVVNRRMALSNILQNVMLLTLVTVLCLLHHAMWLPILFIAILILLFLKYYVVRKTRNRTALLYLLLMNVFKPVVFAGQIGEWVRFIFNKPAYQDLKVSKITLRKSS